MKNVFCVHCGKKNKAKTKICTKCKKKLNPRKKLFMDYIINHIKDFFLGNVDGKITNFIYSFIKRHLYGLILTATLIFTGTILIDTYEVINEDINQVNNKPDILLERLNKCNIKNAIAKEYVCEEGYVLDDKVCKKIVEEPAISNNVCPNGYYLANNRCYSNFSYEVQTKKECILPNDKNALTAWVENDTCLVQWCTGDDAWLDGECQAGYADEHPFTITNYCLQGTMINGKCLDIKSSSVEYYCENGTLSGNKCLITDEKDPIKGCKKGYKINEECNICELEN